MCIREIRDRERERVNLKRERKSSVKERQSPNATGASALLKNALITTAMRSNKIILLLKFIYQNHLNPNPRSKSMLLSKQLLKQ